MSGIGLVGDPCHLALSLRLTPDRKYMVVDSGEWMAPFTVVAGLDGSKPVILPNGLRIEFTPMVALGSGEFDVAGRGYLPIDLQHSTIRDKTMIALQAVAWLEGGALPDITSNVLAEPLLLPETPLLEDPPDLPIWVTTNAEEATFDAVLVSTDGIPPEFTAIVVVTVPTGGYRFEVRWLRWNHDFARIWIDLERPHPGDPVTEGFQTHRQTIDLGHRVDQVEVVVDAFVRDRHEAPPMSEGKK
jgi:hypothetical protein